MSVTHFFRQSWLHIALNRPHVRQKRWMSYQWSCTTVMATNVGSDLDLLRCSACKHLKDFAALKSTVLLRVVADSRLKMSPSSPISYTWFPARFRHVPTSDIQSGNLHCDGCQPNTSARFNNIHMSVDQRTLDFTPMLLSGTIIKLKRKIIAPAIGIFRTRTAQKNGNYCFFC